MKVINASGISEITEVLQEKGYQCIETTEVYDTQYPVIIAKKFDPNAEAANILASSGVPVLFLSWEYIKTHPSVHNIVADHVDAEDIAAWLNSLKTGDEQEQKTKIAVKKSVVVYPLQPGVGSAFISRMLALESAKHRNTVLVEANYRYPKSLFYFGLYEPGHTLDRYIEKILNNDMQELSQYTLNKTKISNPSTERKRILKKLPEKLHMLAPDWQKGYEHFPEMPCEIDQSEGYTRNMIHQLKQHHDSVIVNTLSDLDDCLTLSLLNSADIKIIVADASPPSILSLEQRVETLRSNGLLKQSDRIIINNCHEGMEKELQQRFQQYNCLFVPYEGAVHSDMMRGVHPDRGEIYEKMKELESSIFGTKMQEKSKRSFSSFFSKVSL